MQANLAGIASPEAILQMAVKTVKNTASHDGIVLTLLIFSAYPQISLDSSPSLSTLKRADAIQKTMHGLWKLTVENQISTALGMRNRLVTEDTLALPLQSEIQVWKEKEGWQGPYKVAAIDSHNITLNIPNGPAVFRSTVLQPYYRDESDQDITHPVLDPTTNATSDPAQGLLPVPESILSPLLRKRGRPRGSKNKTKDQDTFFNKKEKDNMDLAIKLQNDGVIMTPGVLFQESD